MEIRFGGIGEHFQGFQPTTQIDRVDCVVLLDSRNERVPRCVRRVDEVESCATQIGLCVMPRPDDFNNDSCQRILEKGRVSGCIKK